MNFGRRYFLVSMFVGESDTHRELFIVYPDFFRGRKDKFPKWDANIRDCSSHDGASSQCAKMIYGDIVAFEVLWDWYVNW